MQRGLPPTPPLPSAFRSSITSIFYPLSTAIVFNLAWLFVLSKNSYEISKRADSEQLEFKHSWKYQLQDLYMTR